MMTRRRQFLGTALGFTSTLLLAACRGAGQTGPGAAEPAGANPIRIGVTFPFSGSQAKLGRASFNGAEVARHFVNEEGGVKGRQVQFARADAPDAHTGVSEATRLIAQERVPVIFGSYVSSTALAISEITERRGVIYVEEAAVDEAITTRGFQYLLRFNPSSSDYGSVAARFAVEQLAPRLQVEPASLKVALVHEDASYGQSVSAAAASTLRQLGAQVVADKSYNQATNDLTPLILDVKQAEPDLIIGTQYLNDSILFWRQAKLLDLPFKAFIGTGAGHSNQDFVKAGGGSVDGVFNVSTPLGYRLEGLAPDAQYRYGQYQERYQQLFNAPPELQATQSFVAMYRLLTAVMGSADGLTPDAIMRAAKERVDLPEGSTITGWGVKFDDSGQNRGAFPAVMQWQGGQLVTLVPERLAMASPTRVPLPAWSER
jgi:branched-chain amino acid transport system substrate-binding protein